jgi:hypothetical protein
VAQWHRCRPIRPTTDVGETRPIILNKVIIIQVVSVPPTESADYADVISPYPNIILKYYIIYSKKLI